MVMLQTRAAQRSAAQTSKSINDPQPLDAFRRVASRASSRDPLILATDCSLTILEYYESWSILGPGNKFQVNMYRLRYSDILMLRSVRQLNQLKIPSGLSRSVLHPTQMPLAASRVDLGIFLQLPQS